jgi:acyl-coenzyme A thioesterase PaaI-like protein
VSNSHAIGHYRRSVTDIPNVISSIPARLGTSLTLDNGQLVGHLSSPRAIASRGAASMAAVAFLIDVVGGMTIDTDPSCWAFTSDLSIRLPRAIAPVSIETRAVILRNGGRSAVCEMPLVVDGVEWGSSLISFAKVSRRDGDPVKPPFDAHSAVTRMPLVPLDETLRSAAGFISRDRSRGEVAAELQTELLNPAGAMQGAVVAGLIEAAAEDLADELLGGAHPYVVIEMEVRFLAQNRIAPIVSSARFVGVPSDGLVRVDLIDDDGRGRLTTSAVVRVVASL